MKKQRLAKIIYAVIISYIMVLSVGYALFSDSLTIKGVASTVDYYSATMEKKHRKWGNVRERQVGRAVYGVGMGHFELGQLLPQGP